MEKIGNKEEKGRKEKMELSHSSYVNLIRISIEAMIIIINNYLLIIQ